jgi:hypothetical protein
LQRKKIQYFHTMGKVFDSITHALQEWIEHQKIFFVATAPLSADAHINCSPKGLDSFRVIGPNTVAYQDLTGSGIETIAHIQENKRIVIMFCAFDGPPKIVRLHGQGTPVMPGDEKFEELNALFPERRGTRAYILIDVSRISDSCGYSIPLYEFRKDRDVMDKWVEAKDDQQLLDYRALKNAESIDGIKGY